MDIHSLCPKERNTYVYMERQRKAEVESLRMKATICRLPVTRNNLVCLTVCEADCLGGLLSVLAMKTYKESRPVFGISQFQISDGDCIS